MKILDVEILSPDPGAAAGFYGSILGLPVDGASVRVGDSRLRFASGRAPAPYHLALRIPSNDVRAAKGWLEERAPLLSDEIFDFEFWNAEAVYFEDLDGNVLELIARHNLQDDRPGSFGPESLLAICEVGVPLVDPPSAIDELEQTFGVPVFSGDRDQFTAVGGEHGLLIVVRAGRAWLPTDRIATEGYAHVTIEGATAADAVLGSSFRFTSTITEPGSLLEQGS
jgi:catechol-2,3-dioxygenase